MAEKNSESRTYRLAPRHIRKLDQMAEKRMRETGKAVFPAEIVREAIDEKFEREAKAERIG